MYVYKVRKLTKQYACEITGRDPYMEVATAYTYPHYGEIGLSCNLPHAVIQASRIAVAEGCATQIRASYNGTWRLGR